MTSNQSNTKILLVLLWVAVLLNMLFADIFSIVVEIVKGGVFEIPLEVTTAMGIAAVVTNIHIAMILLSWLLPHRFNKWTNILFASLTILYVIRGGVLLPHYLIIGGIEVLLLLIVIVRCFRWKA